MNREKLGSIHSPRPTFQKPNFESMMNRERIWPNSSFTAEYKMDNLNRKWSHDDHMVTF